MNRKRTSAVGAQACAAIGIFRAALPEWNTAPFICAANSLDANPIAAIEVGRARGPDRNAVRCAA